MGMRSNTNQVGQGMGQTLSEEEKKQQAQQTQQEAPLPQAGQPRTSTPSAPSQSATIKAAPKPQQAGTGTFTNLKSYLKAAQGGGQQKVAQAATQKVQNVATGAQKGISQAQQTFGKQVEAGSLANMGAAAGDVQAAIDAARKAVYQVPQPAPVAPETQPTQEATQATQATQAIPTPETSAPSGLTPDQEKRFADIINAQYGGPGSLQEAGLYNRAAEKANIAQEAIKQTQTAAGREELLRNIFSQGRDYTRGQSKLDALLLNASQQGVSQLQQQAQQAGNLQQKLQQAQTESANISAGRAKEISDIQQQARKSFLEGRTAEEAGTESRIDKLIKEPVLDENKQPIMKADGTPMTQWDQLPEYYRDIIRNRETTNKAELDKKIAEYTAQTPAVSNAQIKAAEKARTAAYMKYRNLEGEYTQFTPEQLAEREAGIKRAEENYKNLVTQKKAYDTGLSALKSGTNLKALNLSPEEAAVLGISSGEGLYNLGDNLIQNVAAERGRLITKDELARQQALARLAGTDISKALQKDLLYSDMEKAGTQTLQSSLNTEAIRKALDEAQKTFKESAESAELTGTGKKKVSRGNLLGKKTSTYSANVEGNVADMLRQAGYDVSALEPEQTRSLLTNKDLLDKYLKATSTSRAEEANIGGKALEGTAAGASTGAAIGGAPGSAIGAAIGGTLGANTLDPFQATSDLYKELESKLGIKGLGAVGQGVQDIRSGAGGVISGAGNIAGSNVVGDIFRGIGGAVGGINTGAMKAYGSAKAKELAIKDLENKYKQYLAGQGFENRANIANTEATAARTAALQQLLRRQG